MGIATGNPTWEDYPSTNTPITADRLNRIETAIDGSMPGADDNYVTDAEKAALHTHPAVIAQGDTAAAARAAIGAGTSNLAIGTTASTAKAGNYTPPAATATARGIVELATTAETTTGTDTTRAVTPAGVKAVADTKAAASHTHTLADVTDYTAPDLSGYATTAALTSGLSGKANATHSHAISQVTGLQSALDGKQASGSYAAASHSHAIAQVTGLQTALDGKQAAGSYAAASHTHTASQVSDSTATGRSVLTAADAAAARTAIGAGTSSLTIGTTSTTAKAGNYSPPAASATARGIVELATTAEATTGTDTARAVTPAGLKAVADTKANATHSHAITDVTGLQTALDGKQAAGSYAAASHTHTASQVSDSTATGRSVLTAADAAAARTAIGAGTSSLTIGTTASTAKAGNYAPPSASATVKGIVELATPAEATTGTDTARAVTPQGLKAVADTKANATHTHTAAQVSGLSTVATSGSYADLANKPSIPSSPVDIGAAPATQPINAKTGSYTLVSSDAGKLVTVNSSSAATVTVPASMFTAGQRVDVLDLGAGRVTFVAGSGMTLGGTPSLVSREQYSAHSVVFLSGSQAVVVGDLGAA